MTPSSETEFFLGVVPLTNIAITKQKIDFWPQISKFWGQKSTFSPLAANWSLNDQCFQHEKGVSLESRYEGTKIFTPCPQKLDFGPKNGQIWPKTGIFGQFGPGHAGFFGALLVGRLVVVARGLYLARHLFTLYISVQQD